MRLFIYWALSMAIIAASRGLYRVITRHGLTSGDATSHLITIDLIRNNKHRIPETTPQFLLSGPHDYPSFLHKLLSYLPQETVERLEPYVGTVCEVAHGSFLFGATYWVLTRHLPGSANPGEAAFVAALMFGFTPQLWMNEGRVFFLSARPFGALWTSAALFCAVEFMMTGSVLVAIAATLATGIVCVSSKFGVQGLAFISIVMSLLCRTPAPMVIFAVGVIVVMVLSRGYYCRVLTGHVRHSRFWREHLTHVHSDTRSFSYKKLLNVLRTFLSSPKSALRSFWGHPVARSFALMPWNVLLVIDLAVRQPLTRVETIFATWIASAYVVTALISLPWLKFLGRPERYTEFAIVPTCLLVAARFASSYNLTYRIAWMLLLSYSVFLLTRKYIRRIRHPSDNKAEVELHRWASKQPSSVFLTIDLRVSNVICYKTSHRSVYTLWNVPPEPKQSLVRRLIPRHSSFPDPNLEELVCQYQVDYLVVDECRLTHIAKEDPEYHYDLSQFEVCQHIGPYTIYDARPVRGLLHRSPVSAPPHANIIPI